MSDKAENATWMDNVGEVFISNDEDCYWRFPRLLFYNRTLCMTSPWFSHQDESWRLVKTPRTINGNYVSLFLWKKINHITRNHKYTVQLSFKTLGGEHMMVRGCSGNTVSDFGFACYDFCSLQDTKISFLSSCGLMKLFFSIQKNKSITGSLPNITIASKDEDTGNKDGTKKSDQPDTKGISRLLKNLRSLMLDEQSSDVLLKIENREFKAHKVVLKARSAVFSSMFQPYTKEDSTGVVDIPDCTASAFEIFLLYIYTGSADAISCDNVCDVYYAADKYQINDLKSECIEFMGKNLSLENFYEVMSLCFQYNELQLQKMASLFFCQNVKAIIKTTEWQKLLKNFTTQANEFYIKAINA